jgi:hypothetical protein
MTVMGLASTMVVHLFGVYGAAIPRPGSAGLQLATMA